MKVKNKGGTAELGCKCGTWLQHWVKFNGKKSEAPGICATTTCSEAPPIGGHVIKSGGADQKVYIVPICKKCNALTVEFDVSDGFAPLAPAAVAETCAKK